VVEVQAEDKETAGQAMVLGKETAKFAKAVKEQVRMRGTEVMGTSH